MTPNTSGRRHFLRTAAALTAGLTLFKGLDSSNAYAEEPAQEEGLFMIGPVKGYTPQIGTLVSMLNYNRSTIIRSVKALTLEQIDHLHDSHANTIGALIMHLGAVDKFYQINTFEGRQEFNEAEKKTWGAAMELGDRKSVV